MLSEKRPSEWAYAIARDQRRDVETMAANLDAARAKGLEEAAKVAENPCDVIIAPDSDDIRPRTFADVADDIRALIDKEPTA
jgi:hypothetical protein